MRKGSAAATLYLNYSSGTTDIGANLVVRGNVDSHNIGIDNNEIIARNSVGESTLYLNSGSGTTEVGAYLKTGGNIESGYKLYIDTVQKFNGADQYGVTWNPSDGSISCEGYSRRFKKNIATLKDDFTKMLDVKARRYHMRAAFRTQGVEHFGYIAEELEELGLTRLLTYDDEGKPDGVKYKMLAIYLNEVVKLQEKRLSALEAKVEKLAKPTAIKKGSI